MSKRVEEKAMDAWAIYEYREHPKGLYHTCFVDGYKEGYEQAEKDLALTWENIKEIFTIACLIEENMDCPRPLSKEYCEEILKRFNETRK